MAVILLNVFNTGYCIYNVIRSSDVNLDSQRDIYRFIGAAMSLPMGLRYFIYLTFKSRQYFGHIAHTAACLIAIEERRH